MATWKQHEALRSVYTNIQSLLEYITSPHQDPGNGSVLIKQKEIVIIKT